MAWTDERVEKLRELWDKGLSASQIAKELGEGVTRNAVIGKAHRMGLASRPSPVKTDPAKKVKKAVEKKKPSRKAAGGKVSLLELTDRMCKWPIGHPGEPDFHFCGKPSRPGFPYCQEHCAEAYQVQQPRRDRRTNRGRISASPIR
ncbi:GcrA family cell cycle regulator [Luteithermobacter gelatinilyticus]|uniref:GcrA family cell cycle regulator n=1 Tax=Luteithermobacter gelatinilyticus TaxID=2582913 RepID=UPI001105AF03|nr:GcrA family cell cycle regulator [Luteithermobacter gelatinilyticus]|tara:strand:- start:8832 stop:9269 length:438 start_codon:yes stop_codon:yes gene_type:complete